MAALNVLVADDDEAIHVDLKRTLGSFDFECKVLRDFYDTDGLVDYLFELADGDASDERPDILILDHDFGGNSANGIEVIPDIREYAPNLPILLLTTYENNVFDGVCEEYPNVDYARKPIKADDLRQRIRYSVKQIQYWERFEKALEEDKELMEMLDADNRKLSDTLAMERDQMVNDALPVKMQELIQYVFPDIEFTARSFRLLVRNSAVKKADWMRMFRCLKLVDWKNEDTAPSGVKIQKFFEGQRMGYKNPWEYRFSQAGRIFIERRENEKPLILLIDPSHEYSKMSKI